MDAVIDEHRTVTATRWDAELIDAANGIERETDAQVLDRMTAALDTI